MTSYLHNINKGIIKALTCGILTPENHYHNNIGSFKLLLNNVSLGRILQEMH